MKWLGVSLLSLMVVGLARPAAAQPKAEISGGYNWLGVKAKGDDEMTKFPKGWYFDVAGNVTPMISIVGQVTGNSKHFEDDGFKLKALSFMGGVRAGNSGPVRGFGQVLFGGLRLTGDDDASTFNFSETHLAFDLGGGVNVGSGPVGLRLGLDYVRVMKKDDSEILLDDNDDPIGLNGFRFTVGVTFGFGN
jgi:hypothetical protein